MRPFIADGHADSLMWNRDLNVRSKSGHVDFPRLLEAGVGLQCFTIVTRGYPFIGGFPLFAAFNRWPRQGRGGEWTRALWQVEQLEKFCARSEGKVRVARFGQDIDANEEAGTLSAVLGIEGAHALEGKAERVAELKGKGVAFMSLTHLANNALGGSSFPFMGNRGLTQHGRDVLEAMTVHRMSVDLAHASERTLDDVLAHPKARVFTSHTGIRAAGGGWRNLSDDRLRALADKGGVACIIFATVYLGGNELTDVARHIEHALKVMGEDGVALGSDFDGMIPLPKGMKDVTGVPALGELMRSRGHAARVVEKVLGRNLQCFFRETL